MTLLKIENLSVNFIGTSGRVHAISDINLCLAEDEILGLVGESGSGKSVVGLSVLNLLPRNADVCGTILFKGRDLLTADKHEMRRIMGREIAYMPQNPGASLNPMLVNGRQIEEVYEVQGFDRATGRARSLRMMERLLLNNPPQVAIQYPHQLSGGMKQRVIASAAPSFQSDLLVADEPTKGLDSEAKRQSAELFRKIREEYGKAMILITHDLDLAREICDRIAVLYAGEIVEVGSAEQVLDRPIHPYTRGLVNALPRNGMVPIDGQSPARVLLPPGCRFFGRCGTGTETCSRVHPVAKDRPGGVVRCHRCS